MSMNLRLCLFALAPEAGLLAKVQDWVNDYQLMPDDPFDYAHEARYLVLSRLLLAQGKVAEAVKLLERLHQAANAEGRTENQLRYQILQALGYHTLNQKSQALRVLADACELGKAQGFCRIFVDEGPVIQSLLEQLAQRQESPYLQKLLSAFPPTATEIAPNSPPVVTKRLRPEAPWIEPLSERELKVLQLLASGNSNKEISKALELSPNTVRWYVSNILSKLGVSSRLEAVARARELGVL